MDSWQFWFTLGVVGLVFWGLVRNRAPDALLLGAVVLCALAGIISPKEALAGFSNAGMLTVGALYVVAAGLRETGALGILGSWMFGRIRTERGALARLSLSVPAMSAFLNNTPIVAMFIPVITDWCRKNRVSVSRLLIPLSYLSIFGGTCTLIGTSTNLVVNGLMLERWNLDPATYENLKPMGLFELSAVGVPYAIFGILYLVLVGRRLLPDRKPFLEDIEATAREYLANLRIQPGCRLVGQTIENAGLRHLPGLFLIEITRGNQRITPVGPDQILQGGDILTFTGVVDTIVDLEKIPGLVSLDHGDHEDHAFQPRESMLYEAVVSNTSPIIEKTIRDSDFRALYNAAVVAVHRGGQRLGGRVGDIVVQHGDTLLLQAGQHFARAHRNNPDFYLVSGIEGTHPVRHERALLSLALLGLLVLLMATGLVSIVVAAFLVAGLMVATRCLSAAEARQSVDIQTLITIAAAFGLGHALENAGVVTLAAGAVVHSLGNYGPYLVLAGIFLATSIFTEVVTNNAAAALMFPFAIAMGMDLGVSPRPFAIAVALAASASFITPLGYQTNLMVFGPGGYRFSDFARIGVPLNLLMLVVASLLIPLIWSF